nr:transposase domain-containing protein [Burkholderia mayonis]
MVDLATMLCSLTYIACDSIHEVAMANRLVAEGRTFDKPLRLDEGTDVLADFFLTDSQDPTRIEVYRMNGVSEYASIDHNWLENQIRPWATGRSNRLFASSLRAGKRANAIMSLIRSAQLNGHDPYASLKGVLARLPTHRADDIAALLPHRCAPASA